jgi:uncharacterized protein (DUF2062 family)
MAGRSRISRWLEQLLHTHDTPQRTAAAYAVGVFFGFSPFLGLHAILGLVFAFLFGLNRVAVIVGVYSNLPWILPAYYTVATIGGAKLLGVDLEPAALKEAIRAFESVSWRDLGGLVHALAPLVWAYTVGSTIGAVLAAGVAYRVSLALIVGHRQRQEAHAREKSEPPQDIGLLP